MQVELDPIRLFSPVVAYRSNHVGPGKEGDHEDGCQENPLPDPGQFPESFDMGIRVDHEEFPLSLSFRMWFMIILNSI